MNPEKNSRRLSKTGIEQAMEPCAKLHRVDPGESFIRHCRSILASVLGSIRFSAELYRLKPFRLVEQEIHTPDYNHWFPMFKERVLDHPNIRRHFMVANSNMGATHLEPASNGFRYSTLYTEFHDQILAPCQLWIGIREGSELFNCIYSHRRVCTEEELAMMCLIQSNLESAWKSWQRTRDMKQELDLLKGSVVQSEEKETIAAQTRQALGFLTDRQREVVELLALGNDNQQIADKLKISVLTVKKHLQTIFQSLGVLHRTELVAKWHQAYSIQLAVKPRVP